MNLPPVALLEDIQERLNSIFPEGTPHQTNCTGDMSAKTVFTMLYIGAVDGNDIWLRPDQVTRMTTEQSMRLDKAARIEWLAESMKNSKGDIPGRWYAVNSRESIRDDGLRFGLLANGAAVERTGLPTTSPLPRYALQTEFSQIFNPSLTGLALTDTIAAWQDTFLSVGGLARIRIMRAGAIAAGDNVQVTFPNKETRQMAPGPSSVISKAVVEEFATAFLIQPAVIFLSESANKVVTRDDELASSIGLNIEADKNLPDLILIDLGTSHPLIVFVEVVATDGPMNEMRKAALHELTTAAGFPEEHVTFVTAFEDRNTSAFKKAIDSIAWDSFVWFASEPKHILHLNKGISAGLTLDQILKVPVINP